MSTIIEILKSKDPLSDENFRKIISHAEEDILVDYKEDFDPNSEKAWLGITKDIVAFYNTHGGFLIFGVRDGTFEHVGIEPRVARILGDAINVIQKINRFIEPEISNIRSKKFIKEGKEFVIIYIPNSESLTCMFKSDGKFKYPSGHDKYEFRQGTTYLRISAGNHLVDSRDLDFIFNKRLKIFRQSILSNLVRVVEAPSESEVFIVSKDKASPKAKKFIIEDSPDAIPGTGMSFTIEPQTDEQEIIGSISINRRNPLSIPHTHTLWEWYKKREILELTNSQKCSVAKFCIIKEIPVFYWLRNCKAEKIKLMLEDTLKYEGSNDFHIRVLIVAHFLGVGTFNYFIKKLGKKADRISKSKKRYVKDDVFSIVNMGRLGSRNMKLSRETDQEHRKRLQIELSGKVETMVDKNPRTPNYTTSDEAFSFDCFLYARIDKYQVN